MITKYLDLKNHSITLENYIDRYECIRVQNMIADTLNAIFPINTPFFRKLEIFDSQRMAMFYGNLFPSVHPVIKTGEDDQHSDSLELDDKSTGDVKRLIE